VSTATQNVDDAQEIARRPPPAGSTSDPDDQPVGEAAAGEARPAANIVEVTADSNTTAANRRTAASFGILSPYGSELQWTKATGR
jgi:hypothetical protein